MSKFSWQTSSLEELAQKIVDDKSNTLRQQINYYKFLKDIKMLSKIDKAKELAKLWKLEAQVEEIKRKIECQ